MTQEFWIDIADNGYLVTEIEEGYPASRIVITDERDLGKLIIEYIKQKTVWDNHYHIKMDIK